MTTQKLSIYFKSANYSVNYLITSLLTAWAWVDMSLEHPSLSDSLNTVPGNIAEAALTGLQPCLASSLELTVELVR